MLAIKKPCLNPAEVITPLTGCGCSLSSNLTSTGARQVRPLKASQSLTAEVVLHLPPQAASATILCHSLCPFQLLPPSPLPRAAEAATCTLCVREQHFWQGDWAECCPKSSWTPSGVSYSSATYTAVHGAPNETVRQDHVSATLHDPCLSLSPPASPRHQACFSLWHGNTLCIIKDTFPKRLQAHYSATTVTCLNTQNVHFSSKEWAHPGSSLMLEM